MLTTVQHGCYSETSPYDVVQHDHAAAGAVSYIELLQITDPPEGRSGFVIHFFCVEGGSIVVEFNTLEAASQAFQPWSIARALNGEDPKGLEALERNPEIVCIVRCGEDKPWFYHGEME